MILKYGLLNCYRRNIIYWCVTHGGNVTTGCGSGSGGGSVRRRTGGGAARTGGVAGRAARLKFKHVVTKIKNELGELVFV